MTNKLEQQITLRTNRTLGFAEFGNPSSYPIVYCHGSQSSRLEMHYDLSFATKFNLRIITIDRPGHGLSDLNPTGTILSFTQDVIELMDHLNIELFSVVGMSAGSPFALGMAHSFPKRVNKVAIISGFAPFNSESKKFLSKEIKSMLTLAKSLPLVLRLMLKVQVKQLRKNPEKSLKGFLKIMSAQDQKVLENKAVIEIIKNMFTEAFRNGGNGVAYEISKILVQDWGFNLADIKVPVKFWQGEEDYNVPHQWAKLMKQKIPNSELKIYPNEGHLIIFNHAEEIFSGLKTTE